MTLSTFSNLFRKFLIEIRFRFSRRNRNRSEPSVRLSIILTSRTTYMRSTLALRQHPIGSKISLRIQRIVKLLRTNREITVPAVLPLRACHISKTLLRYSSLQFFCETIVQPVNNTEQTSRCFTTTNRNIQLPKAFLIITDSFLE